MAHSANFIKLFFVFVSRKLFLLKLFTPPRLLRLGATDAPSDPPKLRL